MPRMRSLQPHPWGHGIKAADDEFDASDQEAQLLIELKWAESVGERIAPRRGRPPRTRDMQAAPAMTYHTK